MTGSNIFFPIFYSPLFPELIHSGSTPPSPSLSTLLLTTFVSSMLVKRSPTTSSKPSRTCTPSLSTGPVPSSLDLPLYGITPHVPSTYPCPTISRQPYINSNILLPNARNMPPTHSQIPTTVHMCNMQRMTILLLSFLPKLST